jgi:GNAT superfamily N-acetyltransferase
MDAQPELHRKPFTEADTEHVQGFRCGDASYEKEVAGWLKNTEGDCAITSIAHPTRPSRVWLYTTPEGTLVGFGALGQSDWRWKGKSDPKVPVTLIIWVGLCVEFQGKPEGVPREQKYSTIILNDLIGEAEKDQASRPVIGLLVHKDNVRAIKLYERFGFAQGFEPYIDKTTGSEYIRMAVVLDETTLLRLRDAKKKSS